MPKIITLSGNGKVGKRHPLSKKGIKNTFRDGIAVPLTPGFLIPTLTNNHIPGKFTNAKFHQTQRLVKPSTRAPYVVNYDYNHYQMCPGSST